jgi:hypothetical protein
MLYETQVFSKPIPGFENYFVNTDGWVVNVNTGRLMALSPNLNGELMVGLMREGKQYKRSVKVLVAEAFVDGKTDLFNTPIQLNHVRDDLRADNLCWRPRWFAWKYYRQFEEMSDYYFGSGVREINSGLEYENILHAAVTHGLLCADILFSIYDGPAAWPTSSRFQWI